MDLRLLQQTMKKLLLITFGTSVIGLFLMFYLSKKFGIIGASAAYLSTVFVNNTTKLIYLWHKLNILSIPTLMLKKEINYLMKKFNIYNFTSKIWIYFVTENFK